MSKRTFCDANDELRSLINDVICVVSNAINYEEIGSLYEALEDLKKIEDITNETQDYVDSMENRLKKYRKAIENLGFIKEACK